MCAEAKGNVLLMWLPLAKARKRKEKGTIKIYT